jgi:hypothetical protein
MRLHLFAPKDDRNETDGAVDNMLEDIGRADVSGWLFHGSERFQLSSAMLVSGAIPRRANRWSA